MPQTSLVPKRVTKESISINRIMRMRLHFKFYTWRWLYPLKHVQGNYPPLCCERFKRREFLIRLSGIINN